MKMLNHAYFTVPTVCKKMLNQDDITAPIVYSCICFLLICSHIDMNNIVANQRGYNNILLCAPTVQFTVCTDKTVIIMYFTYMMSTVVMCAKLRFVQ
jgi:hypothetical protein